MQDPLLDLMAKEEVIANLLSQRDKLIVACFKEGYTLAPIADAMGMSYDGLRMYCKRHKLYTPRNYERIDHGLQDQADR